MKNPELMICPKATRCPLGIGDTCPAAKPHDFDDLFCEKVQFCPARVPVKVKAKKGKRK